MKNLLENHNSNNRQFDQSRKISSIQTISRITDYLIPKGYSISPGWIAIFRGAKISRGQGHRLSVREIPIVTFLGFRRSPINIPAGKSMKRKGPDVSCAPEAFASRRVSRQNFMLSFFLCFLLFLLFYNLSRILIYLKFYFRRSKYLEEKKYCIFDFREISWKKIVKRDHRSKEK